jgi:membrane peptidoglycan carboxypeptidase
MRYCNYLLNNLGVEGTLPLTLTMPLGAVELTLLDAAMLYNGLLTGQRTKVDDESAKGNVLIERIEGPTGEVLYEAKPATQQVSNFVSGMLLSNILHNVVQHGTGRRARALTNDSGVYIPVVGKTGTTNGYRNAAFVGMVPKAQSGSWELLEGVTIATYVGFDDNTPMRFGRTALSGASGALPVWMETVRGIAKSEFIGFPKSDMTFSAPEQFGFHSVPVAADVGYPSEEGQAETWIYNPNVLWGQEPSHIRAFAPVDANEVPQWKEPLQVLIPDTVKELNDVRLVPTPMDVLPTELDSGNVETEEFRLVPANQ